MSLKSVPLSALSPSKSNPRRKIDQAAIEGLAASIKTDGVLQNLVVEPCGEDKFRIVSGHRRYFALKLLKRRKAIDDDFKVPVDIRKNLDEADALRIATIENVQRADLDPIDEAEAFATMLQNGAAIEDVSAKTGLSDQTIRRRLALANLSKPVKAAVRKCELPLGIAEALTLATEDQQRQFLKEIREGADLDRDAIRELLLAEKPSAAIAIFPLEKYAGTFTRDLFGDDGSTYFDDWWTPDAEFLAFMRKDQLDAVAIESGTSLRLGKTKAFSKKDLVDGLAQQFERADAVDGKSDERDEKVRQWLPGAMSFPARASVTMADVG